MTEKTTAGKRQDWAHLALVNVVLLYKFTFTYFTMYEQEAQLMLTNPRDAFRGQSRSPNSIIPYVRYTFLLCNSNFDFKTFSDIRRQKVS